MIYLSTLLIAMALMLLEVSLAPHLMFIFPLPLFLLPFISIISLKDRTVFPIILAFIMGIIMDAAVNSTIPIYLFAYLSVVIISRVFMGRFISYGEGRANIINIGIGIMIIYGVQIFYKLEYIKSWHWLVPLALSIAVTYILLPIYLRLGRRYFSWIEQETEERFR